MKWFNKLVKAVQGGSKHEKKTTESAIEAISSSETDTTEVEVVTLPDSPSLDVTKTESPLPTEPSSPLANTPSPVLDLDVMIKSPDVPDVSLVTPNSVSNSPVLDSSVVETPVTETVLPPSPLANTQSSIVTVDVTIKSSEASPIKSVPIDPSFVVHFEKNNVASLVSETKESAIVSPQFKRVDNLAARSKNLEKISGFLIILKNKANELKQREELHAHKALTTIIDELDTYGMKYVESGDRIAYQTSVNSTMKAAESNLVLNTHRGWKEILIQLLSIVSAIATFGVTAILSYKKNGSVFFPTPKTDSTEKVSLARKQFDQDGHKVVFENLEETVSNIQDEPAATCMKC